MPPTLVSLEIMHIQGYVTQVIDQLFEPNRMEKDLSSSDHHKGVTEDSVFHVFELVMTHHQL